MLEIVILTNSQGWQILAIWRGGGMYDLQHVRLLFKQLHHNIKLRLRVRDVGGSS